MANVIDLRESITGETDKKKQKTHIITLIISGSDKFYEDNNGVKKLEIEKKKKKLLKLGSQMACSKKRCLRLEQEGATPEM